ncbi:MAG: hypothetical protein Kow0029_31050 [Candidatus Rifleibacteriota bacterium]
MNKKLFQPLLSGIRIIFFLIFAFVLICSSTFAQVQGSKCFERVFNEKAVGHDLANCYLLMYTSLFAYSNQLNAANYSEFKKKFQDLFAPLGIYRFDFVNIRKKTADTQAVVMSNDKVVIVAFRGSELSNNGKFSPVKLIYDWILTDFNFFKKRIVWWGFGVKVHRGFYTATDICYDEMKKIITAHLSGTEKKLWITGHSLGAGIAPIFAYRLAEDGFDIQGIYTFAGPRVGNKDFCSLYSQKFPDHQRYVLDNDLVTKLPFKSMRYDHFVAPNNIYADGRLVLADKEMKGRGKATTHVPSAYIQAIYNLLPLELRDKMPVPPAFRGEDARDAALERDFNKLADD